MSRVYNPAFMARLDYPDTTENPKTGATSNFENEKKIKIWFSSPKITYTQTCQIFKNGQKWLPIGLFFRQFLNLGHWNEIFFKTSNYLKKFEMYWFHCLFIHSQYWHTWKYTLSSKLTSFLFLFKNYYFVF